MHYILHLVHLLYSHGSACSTDSDEMASQTTDPSTNKDIANSSTSYDNGFNVEINFNCNTFN